MKINTLITTLAIIIALLIANYLAARHPLRLDLTQNSIYSLSGSTPKLLSGLNDVLTVRVYFSRDLPPAMEGLRRDVDDLLDEYKSVAGKRFQVEHIDPASSMMEEQNVAMMGIPPLQINVIKRDKQEVAKIYLGIAVMYGGRQEVIPVVEQTRNLEYLLDEAILRVSSKELEKIAWWQGRFDKSDEGNGFGIIREILARRYEIVDVKEGLPAVLDPKDVKALVILSPRKLSQDDLNAIDSYFMQGGRVIALIDLWEVENGLKLTPVETNITDLLKRYGVSVEKELVLDESNAAAAFTGGIVTYNIPYPYWPDVRREGFDQNLPISRELNSTVFLWTSPLVISDQTDLMSSRTALAVSSPYSTAVPGDKTNLDPKAAGDALRSGNHQKLVLAALLEGPSSSRLFVTGSSHWVNDRFLPMFPQNADLLQNAVDSFAMGDLLIGIRSREGISHPIAIIPDAARFWFKYLNVASGPIAVGIIGMILFAVRRARKQHLISKYCRPYEAA